MIYSFGQFELDTRVYELRQAGRPVPVEPQVFDVLAYLATNRDRVISKQELLDKLWADRFVAETTLTTRLKEARKAVGDSGKAQLVIRTHHGRGYRFVADVQERDDPSAFALTSCVSGQHLVPITREPPAPSAGTGDRSSAPATATNDFVGRAEELRRLRLAWERAADGTRQIVFVTGEAGAGKSTLVDEFLSSGPADACRLARGQCVEHRGSGEPYMPLLDALTRLTQSSNGAEAFEILRRSAPSWILQMPSVLTAEETAALSAAGGSGERMLRELGIAIERLSADRPLILFLEDLHWSDSATLEAIDLIARQDHPARLLLIGTFRPSDVRAASHPLYAVTRELNVRGRCEMIPLARFDQRELADYLLIHFPDADFIDELAGVIHTRTAGNPLFAGNLVESWTGRGWIAKRDGRWRLECPMETLESDVPATLQELIEKQFSELPAEEQKILETASVTGRSFPVALLAAALPAADEDLERVCEELVRSGRFLRFSGTGPWGDGTFTSRFSFTHDLHVDVLYERIPRARRIRLHRQIGLALERAWEGREIEHVSELALHFQRALDRDRAVRYLRLASEQALRRNAYREAVNHLDNALAILMASPPSEDVSRAELEIRCLIAPALIATRGWGDAQAEQNYHRTCELARQLADDTRLSHMLYHMATMYEYRGDYTVAERLTMERLAVDKDSDENVMESFELLTCSLLHQGRYEEACSHARRVIEAASRFDVLEPEQLIQVIQVHGWYSCALLFTGRPLEALDHSGEALRLAEAGADDLSRASATTQAAFLRFYRREGAECRTLAGVSGTIARERRFPFHLACARILNGWWLSESGDHEAALREIRGGLRTCRSIGARMDLPLFLSILAEALHRAGDRAGALETIDDAISIIANNRAFFYSPELHRLRGVMLLEQKDRRVEAFDALEHSLAIAREQHSVFLELRTLRSLVNAGDDSRANQLAAVAEVFNADPDLADVRESREIARSV